MAAHPATVVRTPGVLREAPATGPLASPGVARLVGFVPLAGFGALQWGALLTPKADGSLLLGVLAATAAGGLLLVTGRDSRRAVRVAGAAGAAPGVFVLAPRIARVPLRPLQPPRGGGPGPGVGAGPR